jgi:hypothetical protein
MTSYGIGRATRRTAMDLVLVMAVLVALAFAALRWGVDSTDGPLSPEWERRRSTHGDALVGHGTRR